MLSKTEVPAGDAGTSLKYLNTASKPVNCHSKSITTFKSQKFKNEGKINTLKAILCYESDHFSAPTKASCNFNDDEGSTSYITKQSFCDLSTENTAAGVLFIANLPRTSSHNKRRLETKKTDRKAVSYTHLTLPTNREV